MSNRPRETLINHRRIQWISVFSVKMFLKPVWAQGSIEIRYDAQSAFIVNALGKIKNSWMIAFYKGVRHSTILIWDINSK